MRSVASIIAAVCIGGLHVHAVPTLLKHGVIDTHEHEAKSVKKETIGTLFSISPGSNCELGDAFVFGKGCIEGPYQLSRPLRPCTDPTTGERTTDPCVYKEQQKKAKSWSNTITGKSSSSTMLETSSEVEGTGYGVTASLSLKTSSSAQMTTESSSAVLYGAASGEHRILANLESAQLKPYAQQMLESGDTAQFAESYGYHYVTDIAYGGSFTGYFTMESTHFESSKSTEAKAALDSAITGGAQASSAVSSISSESNSEMKLSYGHNCDGSSVCLHEQDYLGADDGAGVAGMRDFRNAFMADMGSPEGMPEATPLGVLLSKHANHLPQDISYEIKQAMDKDEPSKQTVLMNAELQLFATSVAYSASKAAAISTFHSACSTNRFREIQNGAAAKQAIASDANYDDLIELQGQITAGQVTSLYTDIDALQKDLQNCVKPFYTCKVKLYNGNKDVHCENGGACTFTRSGGHEKIFGDGSDQEDDTDHAEMVNDDSSRGCEALILGDADGCSGGNNGSCEGCRDGFGADDNGDGENFWIRDYGKTYVSRSDNRDDVCGIKVRFKTIQ